MTAPRIAFVAAAAESARQAHARLSGMYDSAPPDQADIVVALGGDGHMLETLHAYRDRDAPRRAGFEVDVPQVYAEFLDDLQRRRGVEFGGSDRDPLAHGAVRFPQAAPELVLGPDHPDGRRKQVREFGPEIADPAVEIRNVDAIVVGDRGVPLRIDVGVQDRLDGADDDVVFRDDDRHVVLRAGLRE